MNFKYFSLWVALMLLARVALAEAGGGVEIWITPTGNGGGSGTQADPFSTPDADSFFNLVHDQRKVNGALYVIPEYSILHLLPGLFSVREGFLPGKCPRHCLTPKRGWKIHGAGMDTTVLKIINLPQDATDGSHRAYVIGGNGGVCVDWDTPINDVEVSDLTVDCNLQAQTAAHNVQAVGLAGSDNRIRRVRAINWGTTQDGNECFVLGLSSHYKTREPGDHNGVIEECIVEQPAAVRHAMTSTAIYVGNANNPGGGWVIRNCVVRNVETRGSGKPPTFNAYTANGRGAEVYQNQAINLTGGGGYAFYNDSWTCQDINIHDNLFMNVDTGVTICNADNNATNILIVNNLITFTDKQSGINFRVEKNHVFRGIQIEGNTIYPYLARSQGNALAINGKVQFSADNNVLESGAGKYRECLISGGEYANVEVLSFRDNHNLRGTRLALGEWYQDYIFTGNEEEEWSFTPTVAGWHKVMLLGASASARVNFWSAEAPNKLDLELAIRHHDEEPDRDELRLLRDGSIQGNLAMPKVRLAQYRPTATGDNRLYEANSLDIFVSRNLVGKKVHIRVNGMMRAPNYVKDFVPAPPRHAPLRVRELTLSSINHPESKTADNSENQASDKNQPFTVILDDVDATVAGNVSLLTVPEGHRFITTSFVVETLKFAGESGASAATLALGSENSPSNIVALVSLNAETNSYQAFTPNLSASSLPAGAKLTLHIETPSTATNHTLAVSVTGFYR